MAQSLPMFILASALLIVAPGPDLIYVLTRGVSGGRVAGLASAVGVTSGILVHTVAASLGLAVLLQTSTYAFWILKIIGSVYLVYLGLQMIRNRKQVVPKRERVHFDSKKCMAQGFLSNVLNPKVALLFVVFLPQFVQPGTQSQTAHMVMLGLLFALMTITFLALLGFFAGTVFQWLRRKGQVGEWVGGLSGMVLTILGLRLLLRQGR